MKITVLECAIIKMYLKFGFYKSNLHLSHFIRRGAHGLVNNTRKDMSNLAFSLTSFGVRKQGGHNAGHTLVIRGEKTVNICLLCNYVLVLIQ